MRVALFITCFNDTMFPQTGKAVVRLLERLGVDVEFPEERTCCGQMHFNTGHQRECIPLVRRFARVFAGYEAIVAPSGSCAAILTPQLRGVDRAGSLPYASSLCGACYDVCPVKINIPEVLVHLRNRVVEAKRETRRLPRAEELSMEALAWVFTDRRRYEQAQRLARVGQWPLARSGRIRRLPAPFAGWTEMRDAPAVAAESFRDWWRARQRPEGGGKA